MSHFFLFFIDDSDNFTYVNREPIGFAVRSHLEILLFLSISVIGRRHFLQSSIIDQLLNLLENDHLSYQHSLEEELFSHVGHMIANALMLLCNLSYEQQLFTKLKEKDLQAIYLKYKSKKDNSVKFPLELLEKILQSNEINEDNDPKELQNAYAEHLDQINIKSKEIRSVDVKIPIDRTSKSIDSYRNEITRSLFLRTTYSSKEERKNGRKIRR